MLPSKAQVKTGISGVRTVSVASVASSGVFFSIVNADLTSGGRPHNVLQGRAEISQDFQFSDLYPRSVTRLGSVL
jgi:hypothetical protein